MATSERIILKDDRRSQHTRRVACQSGREARQSGNGTGEAVYVCGSSRRTSIVVVRPSGHPSLSRPKPEVWTSPPLLVPATCLLAGAGLPTVEPVHMIGEQFAFSTIVASGSSIASSGSIPEWNGATRRLYFEGVLVKEFRQPAENQEIVLAAFEAKGWEVRVDDPLPPDAGPDVRDRLKNTVKGLNRQKCPLLWFSRDGLGRGICWQRR